jgi:hypothetical protein
MKYKIDSKKIKDVEALVSAPVNEELEPEKRLESCIEMSDLVAKMVTFVICHVIVDYAELLKDERVSVASAFLQRVTSTHLCNHKLTKEGIVFKYRGEAFDLHEEFKTMTLTRSVYEHLVMFYFLYVHPKSAEERSVVWNYWKINSKKNLLDYSPEGSGLMREEQEEAQQEIEELRREIFSTQIGVQCRKKLDEWTGIGKPTQNGCIEFYRYQGRMDVRRVSYSQGWKYLFDKEEMTLLYRHLSIHCHPIYNGLLQYQSQAQSDEGYDGLPLYLSSCFLSYLCRLFLRQIPNGGKLLRKEFSKQEIYVFNTLSQLPIGEEESESHGKE